jgi:choline dehydrogenase-like flavoprotein
VSSAQALPGAAAAKVLTEGGASVAMLEAAPPVRPAADFKEHLWPYDLPHRCAGVGGKLRGEEADEFMAPNGA